MKSLFHNVLKLKDHTTEIKLSHCEDCARAAKFNQIGTAFDCSKRGTLHGTPKSFYNPFIAALRSLIGLDIYTLKTHNLITNAGHAAANGRMSNQGGYSPFVNIAIGIGTTAAAAGDTALQSEITTGGGARGAATTTQVTTSVTNDTTQLVKTFTFSSSFAVTEEGILDNATSGGTLLARQVFSALNVVSGDQIQFTHKYQS